MYIEQYGVLNAATCTQIDRGLGREDKNGVVYLKFLNTLSLVRRDVGSSPEQQCNNDDRGAGRSMCMCVYVCLCACVRVCVCVRAARGNG